MADRYFGPNARLTEIRFRGRTSKRGPCRVCGRVTVLTKGLCGQHADEAGKKDGKTWGYRR